jgi:cytochrome c oxidase cbb3-type subunit 4
VDLVTLLRTLFTVLVPLAFIAIVIWAYSKRRKKDFDEAANLPFADEDLAQHDDTVTSKNEGDPR